LAELRAGLAEMLRSAGYIQYKNMHGITKQWPYAVHSSCGHVQYTVHVATGCGAQCVVQCAEWWPCQAQCKALWQWPLASSEHQNVSRTTDNWEQWGGEWLCEERETLCPCCSLEQEGVACLLSLSETGYKDQIIISARIL
jgi:hypothetical protein